MSKTQLNYIVTILLSLIIVAEIPFLDLLAISFVWLAVVCTFVLLAIHNYFPEHFSDLVEKLQAKGAFTEPLSTIDSRISAGLILLALLFSGSYITFLAYLASHTVFRLELLPLMYK